MASEQADKAVMEQPPSSQTPDAVTIELPAPQGWTKKFIPKKGGTGTPRRNEILFIAPTGEEIKNKRQLDQYLKTHPDGPSSSEFDWGTGDTPRRSARLSSKSKPTDSGSSRKRQKKARSKKEETDEGESAEDEAAADRTEDNKTDDDKDVEMIDAEAVAEEEKTDVDADTVKEQKADGSQSQAGENKMEEVLEEISEVPDETKKEEHPEENKVETTLESLPSQGGEQPEDNKPEAMPKTLPSQEEEQLEDKKTEAIPESLPSQGKEQSEDNKPEAVEKPSDVASLGDANNVIEENPAENKQEPEEKPVEAFVQSDADVSKHSDIASLGDANNVIEEISAENKQEPEEKPVEAFVQSYADVSLMNTEKIVIESCSANVEKEIGAHENKIPEEVGPDTNTAKERQEGAMHTENQAGNPDGAPQEPGAARPISC